MPEAPNAVRELAEDATSRKKFLRQAGGTGVAASLAAFIAACGGDDMSSSSKATPAATTMASGKSGTEQFGEGDLGIANYALTLEYLEADFYARPPTAACSRARSLDTARSFGDEEQEHVDALIALIKKAGGKPASKPKAKFPLESEKDDPEARRDRREPRRQRLPRPGRQHPGQGDPGRRPVDPLGRGAPRVGPEPRHRRQAEHGRVRQAGDRRRGPEGRQAVPGHLAPKGRTNPMENIEIQGMSRGAFLVRGALATGAAYGAASVTPWVTGAFAQEGGGDIDILNFALTLEYLEADFYKQARQARAQGRVQVARQGVRRERAGARRRARPPRSRSSAASPSSRPRSPSALKSQKDFEKLAITLEDTGVSAYNGAAPMIKSKEVLAAAGSIVQVEARHAAALRFLGGMNPTLGAFDKTLEQGGRPEGRQAADQGLELDPGRLDSALTKPPPPAARRLRSAAGGAAGGGPLGSRSARRKRSVVDSPGASVDASASARSARRHRRRAEREPRPSAPVTSKAAEPTIVAVEKRTGSAPALVISTSRRSPAGVTVAVRVPRHDLGLAQLRAAQLRALAADHAEVARERRAGGVVHDPAAGSRKP